MTIVIEHIEKCRVNISVIFDSDGVKLWLRLLIKLSEGKKGNTEEYSQNKIEFIYAMMLQIKCLFVFIKYCWIDSHHRESTVVK